MDKKQERDVDIESGTEVSEFLEGQGIEGQEVLVSRNGTIISDKHVLEEGDTVEVFDVIAGG